MHMLDSKASSDECVALGVTFVIPLLLDLVRSFVPGGTKCTRVELVWAVRSEAALAWFADALATAVKNAPEGLSVSVSCYVTDGKSTAAADEADDASVHKQGTVERHTGRPDLPDVVKTFCSESGTVAIASASATYSRGPTMRANAVLCSVRPRLV